MWRLSPVKKWFSSVSLAMLMVDPPNGPLIISVLDWTVGWLIGLIYGWLEPVPKVSPDLKCTFFQIICLRHKVTKVENHMKHVPTSFRQEYGKKNLRRKKSSKFVYILSFASIWRIFLTILNSGGRSIFCFNWKVQLIKRSLCWTLETMVRCTALFPSSS